MNTKKSSTDAIGNFFAAVEKNMALRKIANAAASLDFSSMGKNAAMLTNEKKDYFVFIRIADEYVLYAADVGAAAQSTKDGKELLSEILRFKCEEISEELSVELKKASYLFSHLLSQVIPSDERYRGLKVCINGSFMLRTPTTRTVSIT